MPNELQFYNAAKAALAKAVKADEVKHIHNKASAIKAAAKIAKDKTLEANAQEIRIRAERCLGEMMAQQTKASGGEHGGRKPKDGIRKNPANAKATLKEAGIDKNLAHAARTEAAKSPEQFEQDIAAEKERITKPKLATIKSSRPPATPAPVKLSESARCLAEFKVACDTWLPKLNADDLKRAQAYFQERASTSSTSLSTRPTGSAEQSAEEHRAINAKLAEEHEKLAAKSVSEPIAKQREAAPA